MGLATLVAKLVPKIQASPNCNGENFGTDGQRSLKFQACCHLKGRSLSRREVDEQDGGADNQREVGHA